MNAIDSIPAPLRALAALDLNLLVVLDALLATHSTTATARLLGKTQSTVSHALDRARDAIGDPLLVRVGRGLAPTPRASSLAEPLRAWLATGAELLRGSSRFDPATLRATFTIVAPDFAETIILPRLVPLVRAAAPGVTLDVRARGDSAEDALRDGDADLFLGAVIRERDGLVTQALYRDRLAVVLRSSHPLARGTLTLARYVAAPHLLVSPRGLPGGIVDDVLARGGRSRQVVLRTPTFATAAHLAASTDLVTTLPESYARAMAAHLPLAIRPLPLAVPPLAMQQVYRVTRRTDAALAWLRGLIVDAARSFERDRKVDHVRR